MSTAGEATRPRARRTRAAAVALTVTVVLVAAACSSDSDAASPDTTVPTGVDTAIPAEIQQVMDKARYSDATWSLLVTDVDTGETFYSLNPDQMLLTGSTRKLFSVAMTLETLGAEHRETTPVYRAGTLDPAGTLDGDLVLVGAGDLVFGGRRIDADTVEYTNFDHNDANNLGTAILSPQDPLFAVDDLARQVKASGITEVRGEVVIDDRLWEPYRVPNGNLLITPVMLNENMVDVTVTPTEPGQPAKLDYRPETAAFTVVNEVMTTPAGTEAELELSNNGRISCFGTPGCSGTVSGTIPVDYRAPLSDEPSFVGTFRVEEPNAFMRTAFIEALGRNGVTVTAPAVAPNPAGSLPAADSYADGDLVASFESAPYREYAQLVLKVSLNLGANASLSLFGVDEGARTIQSALAAERTTLTEDYGISGNQIDFPTNGSGTPDSQAAPRALVDLLLAMSKTPDAGVYRNALPIMGVDGSLAGSGVDLPGKGHVYAKTGTTIAPGPDGETLQLKAQNFAGYIETKSGRTVAFALMVNDAGPVQEVETDVSEVITDEAVISNHIYENL